jgi:Ca2+-binding EF-hand superfamily protein
MEDGPMHCLRSGFQTSAFVLLVFVTVGIISGLAQADGGQDQISLIILAPKGPVLVDLQISVAGKPYRRWVAGFLSRQLDVDRSGGLTARELERIPDRFSGSLGLESVAAIAEKAADAQLFIAGSDDSSEIPREAFDNWFSQQLSRTMQVVAQGVPPSQAVRLGEMLDTGNDGSVGPEELEVGLNTLRFRDLDDDQTLSATELLPFRDPRNQLAPVTPDAADLPFLQIGDHDSLLKTAERIVRRYGGEVGSISFASLRTHPQLLAAHDKDSNRALNADELAGFLADHSAHLNWNIELSEMAARSRIGIKASPFARRFCRNKTLRNGQRADLSIDEMPIEIRSHGGSSSTRRDLIGFLGQHFSVADEDRDDKLTEEEFGAMDSSMGQAQLMIDFKRADIDEDEYLSRDELVATIETDTIATQSQIEVSVRQDGRTMFSLLDSNHDRRLAQRELQEGKSILAEYDVNEDGQLAESELGTRYVLQIGLGKPEWERQGPQSMSMEMTSTDAILPGIESLSGPQWFRRMDRNQDGDLSRREFLGRREQFNQLDSDGDTLVSVSEAEAITTN